MTHDEIVEKVARATYECRPWGDEDIRELTWETMAEEWKDAHRVMATAALAVAGEMLTADLIEMMGTNGSYAVKRIRALTGAKEG